MSCWSTTGHVRSWSVSDDHHEGLYEAARRLSGVSPRLRLFLAQHAKNGRASMSADRNEALSRLVADVKLQLGEPVPPRQYWDPRRLPNDSKSAHLYLSRAELMKTEMYQKALWSADWGGPRNIGVHPDTLAFAKRFVREAQKLSVPFFVETLLVRPGNWAPLYVSGVACHPRDNPYCHGRGIFFAHLGAIWFPPACVEWIHALATAVANVLHVRFTWSASNPTEFFMVDEDGVICSSDDPLPPEPSGVGQVVGLGWSKRRSLHRIANTGSHDEREALFRYYSGETDDVPWECASLSADDDLPPADTSSIDQYLAED